MGGTAAARRVFFGVEHRLRVVLRGAARHFRVIGRFFLLIARHVALILRFLPLVFGQLALIFLLRLPLLLRLVGFLLGDPALLFFVGSLFGHPALFFFVSLLRGQLAPLRFPRGALRFGLLPCLFGHLLLPCVDFRAAAFHFGRARPFGVDGGIALRAAHIGPFARLRAVTHAGIRAQLLVRHALRAL